MVGGVSVGPADGEIFATLEGVKAAAGLPHSKGLLLVVVFLAEVGDEVFAHHPAQGVFQLH